MEESAYKTDVVIAGGGLAGMVSALELLNAGKKVILLDRAEESRFGGLAKESFGGMFFVNTPHQRKAGIKDDVNLALHDWHSFAEFDDDANWPKKWAELYVNSCTDEVYFWLKKHNIKFFPVVHWVERGWNKPGNSLPRFHMVWGTGHGLVAEIEKHLLGHKNAQNLQLLFKHKVTDISIENGVAKGISGINEENGESFEVEAEAVVIASGGICGNIEKVRQNWHQPWGDPPETILNGSHPEADGLLHDEINKHNGNLTHMDKAWHYAAGVNHPRPHFEGHGLSLVPPKSALWVKYTGERFPIPLITAYDTRFLVEEICKQKKKYSWQILNIKIALKEMAVSGSESNRAFREKNIFLLMKNILFGNKELVNDLLNNCMDFVTANSIEELAGKMNALTGENDVDVNALKHSILNYDANIERGPKFHNDEQLRRIAHTRQYKGDKVRTCKFQKIFDKSTLPLIAIREHILSRKTLGGIQTDLECRVLSKEQQPIEGLFAVGEAAGFGGGGMHGLRSLEGTFLGACVLTGRVAAKTISGKQL
ncbi:MAG: FAD-binding dehydrogenase [Flavobacteriales bacterium]|nr:MAG: FAD-binding dehydrogenase [Flavobacteriales bacterium]